MRRRSERRPLLTHNALREDVFERGWAMGVMLNSKLKEAKRSMSPSYRYGLIFLPQKIHSEKKELVVKIFCRAIYTTTIV